MVLKPTVQSCYRTATPEQREFMGRFTCPPAKWPWILAPGLGLGMGTSGASGGHTPPIEFRAFSPGYSFGFS